MKTQFKDFNYGQKILDFYHPERVCMQLQTKAIYGTVMAEK